MKQEKLKANEVKLQPVSNEKVQQILNGDSKGMAYGCGCGCGDEPQEKEEKKTGTINVDNFYSRDYYEFSVRAVVNYAVTVKRTVDGNGIETRWELNYDKIDVLFVFSGSSREIRSSAGRTTYTSTVLEEGAKNESATNTNMVAASVSGELRMEAPKQKKTEKVTVTATVSLSVENAGNGNVNTQCHLSVYF